MKTCTLTVTVTLFCAAALAQQPIGVGPNNDAGLTPGISRKLNWYSSSPSGCSAGAGQYCVGPNLNGDSFFFTAWMPSANGTGTPTPAQGLPVTTGLPLVGTINDFGTPCSSGGNIAVLQLDTFNWSTPLASRISVVNCMVSYGNAPGQIDTPVGWAGKLINSGGLTGGSWKNRAPFSKGGILYIPVERQIPAGDPAVHDATFIMSPDSGAHWCNPYTYFSRSGGPGCDATNWSATGDAPECDAAGGVHGGACTNVGYTDATHSSMMWKSLPAGTENWSIINWGNQDGQPPPAGAGVKDGCDATVYSCFVLTSLGGHIARVALTDNLMDISKWWYYTCPTITQASHCDPTDNANWTQTFASATSTTAYLTYSGGSYNAQGQTANPYGYMYLKEFDSFIAFGQGSDISWSPSLFGPWNVVWRNLNATTIWNNFLIGVPGLGYTVLGTDPPQIRLTTTSNSNPGLVNCCGSPAFMEWDLVLGPQLKGDTFQRTAGAQLVAGGGIQFSDSHTTGSIPRKGLVHFFDFMDRGSASPTAWPFFMDRSNYAAALTPCGGTVPSPNDCGALSGTYGTVAQLPGAVKVEDKNENYAGNFRIVKSLQKSGDPTNVMEMSSAAAQIPALEGNGSYTVAGVYRLIGFTQFNRSAGIWAYGTPSGADNKMISMDQINGRIYINWNNIGNPHYQFISNFTFPNFTDYYFIALTVTAQAGAPSAKLWVGRLGAAGALEDALAGVSYTNTPGQNASTTTPAVSSGPFVYGINRNATNGYQSSMVFGPQMIYSRALSATEVNWVYTTMQAKLPAMGLAIPVNTGTTNTQGVISYTAPDTGACTWEVSESPTYSPLVHDVNATLFAGSNSDGGGVVARKFVIGKRVVATASDTLKYSRALQAYTRHYYRRTCGSQITTGYFDTKNIPLNSTYQDIPQLDPASPGSTIVPTVSATDRTQKIIDQFSGALIRKVTLPTDTNYYESGGNAQRSGSFLNYSGAPRVSGGTPTGPDNGYIAVFPQGDGGPNTAYYIIPSTGESRFLGWSAPGGLNETDNKFYSLSAGNVVVRTYTGNYLNKTPEYAFEYSTTTLLTGLTAALLAFDPTYDSTNFPCAINGAVGDFIHLLCKRSSQDSNAYVGALRISTASVVALTRVDANLRTRWCSTHQIVPMGYTQPMFQIIPHSYGGGGLGAGPYITTLDGAINNSVTTINVAGEPACAACGVDTSVPPARVGDRFKIDNEIVEITVKVSPTQWTVLRAQRGTTAASHSSGVNATADCNMTYIHWKFLEDPLGTDTTNTSYVQDFTWSAPFGHNDATTNLSLSESGSGWVTRTGDLLTQVGQPLNPEIGCGTFAGVSTPCFGNAYRKHPSVGPPNGGWFSDYPLFDFGGTKNGANTMSLVSGQLYKLVNTVGSGLNPKRLAPAAVVKANWQGSGAPFSLIDVSPATLATDATDSYKLCIANANGECYATSVKGEIYVNVPGTPSLKCDGDTDVCVTDFIHLANGPVQIKGDGTGSRRVTGGLTALRRSNNYPTAKTLADGSYILFALGDIQRYPPSHVLMAKLPPLTAGDTIDRTTFVRAPITITTPQSLGITTATIEFGYEEFDAGQRRYCTSRAEECVVVASTVTDATPFHFKTTDTYTKASCATSCTITIPVLPGHVAYYTVKFYNAGDTFVQNGATGVAVENKVM